MRYFFVFFSGLCSFDGTRLGETVVVPLEFRQRHIRTIRIELPHGRMSNTPRVVIFLRKDRFVSETRRYFSHLREADLSCHNHATRVLVAQPLVRPKRSAASPQAQTRKPSKSLVETSIADKHVDGSWSNSLSPSENLQQLPSLA